MKRFLFFFIASLSIIGFLSGCNNDSTQYYDGIGTVNKTEDSSANYTITLDDGSFLTPTGVDPFGPTLKNEQRVIVRYSIISTGTSGSQYNVKVRDLNTILTKPIFNITAATQDSIGNDPIHIYYMWISGKYLNFELQYNGGYTTHLINLVKDAQKQQDPTGNTVNLELRHNSKGDTGQQQLLAIVSFDLTSLKSTKSPLNLVITNKESYGQTTTNQITYTNNQATILTDQQSARMHQNTFTGIFK